MKKVAPKTIIYPKYIKGEKVQIVSAQYKWGTVQSLRIITKGQTKKFVYSVYLKHLNREREFPEEGLSTHLYKWQWKFLTWLASKGIVKY